MVLTPSILLPILAAIADPLDAEHVQKAAAPFDYLPILFIATAFAGGLCAVWAVGMIFLGRQSRTANIERRIGLVESPVGDVPLENLARDADGRFDRFFYRTLAESGMEISPVTVLLMMLGGAIVAGGIAYVATENVGAVVAAALVGFWPPLLWILWVRRRRMIAMENFLPLALDQIADCLHSGQTLEETMDTVSLQTPSPLKEEFGHCLRLLKMGQSPVAVLDRMSRRIPLPEFRLFATAVLVHRQTGGNLARLTSRLAISARDRQEWRRHLGAQTITGRYSALGLIVCGVVGLTVLSVSRPEYTEIFLTHPKGLWYLTVAVALIVIGSVWISRVVRVHY